MQRIILHFDMSSYFASVEQQANPRLRGRPVGVVATMTPNGCIIASSREAKALGIKTGCRVPEAKALCPHVVLIEVDPPKYRSTSERIFSLYAEYSEDIEPYSIDEAFVDLTGVAASYDRALVIAREIQQRIKDEIGEWLVCSIGIAPTRWLAKFASDTAPKGEAIVLTQDNLFEYLQGRDVQEAWGIAGATATQLEHLGISTLDQLATYPVQNLMTVMGVRGYYLWAQVNGIELSGLEVRRQPKSIGHSHILRSRTRDPRFYQAVLMRLCERTGRRLREKNLEAQGIYFHSSSDHRDSIGGSQKMHHPITHTSQIFDYAWRLLQPHLRHDVPTFFAVGLFHLRPRVDQLTLFSNKKISPRLAQALDALNNKYGEETIVQGPLLRLGGMHAPDRVGFRKSVAAEFQGQGGLTMDDQL
ncbi:MAG: DNA polymerase IV [Candidatus Kerfeldbacteria bacterium]|nr:DNA polymerase IV [Candidatus Kerfeldbacteria bacterium]